MTRPGPHGQEPVRYSQLDDPNVSPWWTRPLAFVYQYVQLQLEGSQVTEELSTHHFGPTLSKFQSQMMPRLERCHPPSSSPGQTQLPAFRSSSSSLPGDGDPDPGK